MDRDTLRRQLKSLDSLVRKAVDDVNRQRRLIEKLKREGRDMASAMAELERIRVIKKQHEEQRRQVARQIISPEVWNAEPVVPLVQPWTPEE